MLLLKLPFSAFVQLTKNWITSPNIRLYQLQWDNYHHGIHKTLYFQNQIINQSFEIFEIGAKENIFRMIHNHAFSQGGLASLTAFFSDIFWQKWGVFVLIRKEISWTFQNSPSFCLLSTSGPLYGLSNANHSFFWDTL